MDEQQKEISSSSEYTDDDKETKKVNKYPHLSTSRIESLRKAWEANSAAKLIRKKERQELRQLRKEKSKFKTTNKVVKNTKKMEPVEPKPVQKPVQKPVEPKPVEKQFVFGGFC